MIGHGVDISYHNTIFFHREEGASNEAFAQNFDNLKKRRNSMFM